MKEPLPKIKLYTDGGADPNPGVGGLGVVLKYKEHRKEIFRGYELTTNNRMEILAAVVGLEELKKKSNVDVYSDSKYVVDSINLKWVFKWKNNNWFKNKDKAENIDLWERLLILLGKHDVKFNWVKGHNGHLENERCDELATLGIELTNKLVDTEYLKRLERGENYGKVLKEGDSCKKCGASVIKRIPKKRKIKKKKTYFYKYYLVCPNCENMYMVESAKVEIDNGTDLFG